MHIPAPNPNLFASESIPTELSIKDNVIKDLWAQGKDGNSKKTKNRRHLIYARVITHDSIRELQIEMEEKSCRYRFQEETCANKTKYGK
jgi:hypothetical protein